MIEPSDLRDEPLGSSRRVGEAPHPDAYDVVIIGGAFSGATSALLLRRFLPSCRILIVERQPQFRRKVGEATVELSTFFLHRVLGLYDELTREHLPKHGLRCWFSDGPERQLAEMTEVGPKEVPRLPAFQVDRARLDERLLAMAVEEGSELMRPAQVLEAELAWPQNHLTLVSEEGEERRVTARWVLDASGRRAFLARQLGLQERVGHHKTSAAWARWRGVADLDGPRVMGTDPRDPALPPIQAARRLATNHFFGYGWWCWMIPLAGGDTSIGVVFDKELFKLPGGGAPAQRYEDFVRSRPGLRELLQGAEMDIEDFHTYVHLPYTTSRYMDRGWALLGDAASFLDPLYSPGLDHAALTIYASLRLIEDDLVGRLDEEALSHRIDAHNDQFVRSYGRWLEALYVGKYELMGDAELMGCAFLVDTAIYYMAVVNPLHYNVEALSSPLFGPPFWQATAAFRLMSGFSRRLRTLARARRQTGLYGRRNVGWRNFDAAFGLGLKALPALRAGLKIWLRLERENLVARFRHGRVDVSRPVAAVTR